jgi:hypothetical protein
MQPTTRISVPPKVRGSIQGFTRPRVPPSLQRGHALTDRDRVDDVPGRTSHLRRHHPAPPKKRGCRPLAGSILSAKDLWHPARSIRSASGRHDHGHPVLRPLQCRTRGSGAPRRPVAERMATGARHAVLGRSRAAGEGTASEFFRKQEGGRTERMSAQVRHHLIAIRKRRPWLESRSADDRTGRGHVVGRLAQNGQESRFRRPRGKREDAEVQSGPLRPHPFISALSAV